MGDERSGFEHQSAAAGSATIRRDVNPVIVKQLRRQR
jgi:hypothetical protein